ncbi:MAG TPA: MoaD/ThiS family protein [Xanthobacteraceae bacterium]
MEAGQSNSSAGPPPACADAPGIRWDAVVDPAATAHGADLARRRAVPRAIDRGAGSVHVHLQLFGALAMLGSKRSIRLQVSAGTTIAELIALAQERLGVPLLAHLLDEAGEKHRHCRLFVGGYPVDELRNPLDAVDEPVEIDIILLIAPEGG